MDNRDLSYENDPRSYNYKRIHLRPKINCYYLLINIILSAIFFVVINFILNSDMLKFLDGVIITVIFILITIIYIVFELKYIVIFLIKMYQILAPDYIRDKCRFEPSCSNYMLIAIQKYGFLKGFIMGIKRLKRCNINDGGYDKP